MTTEKDCFFLSSISRQILVFTILFNIVVCRPPSLSSGNTIQWFPKSHDFINDSPLKLIVKHGMLVDFICKSEHPMTLYLVQKKGFNECRKDMFSKTLCKCGERTCKFLARPKVQYGPQLEIGPNYIIALPDDSHQSNYCKDNNLKMIFNILPEDQPEEKTTTPPLPLTHEMIENGSKVRFSRDRSSVHPISPGSFVPVAQPISPELLNGRLNILNCTAIRNGSEKGKESSSKKGTACFMLDPSSYRRASTDLVDARYLPLHGSSSARFLLFPLLVAILML